MTARRFEFDASIRFRRTVEKRGAVETKTLEKQVSKTGPVGTPRRTIRVADDLWTAAQQIAAERGDDLSAILRRALEDYVAAAQTAGQ